MHKLLLKAVLVLAMIAVVALAATGEEIEMAPLVEYSHAGIVISVPKHFTAAQPVEDFQVMRSAALKGQVPIQVVTLSAYLVGEEPTAEEFAASTLAGLKKSLAIRKLEVLKETPMPVAKHMGIARLLSYSFRGMETTAATVYFIRELPAPAVRICYVLRVESSKEREGSLLPTLGSIINSIALVPLQRPSSESMEPLGEPLTDRRRGYQIRAPLRWFATRNGGGMLTAQPDYLRGGVLIPRLQVVVQDIRPGTTSEGFAKYWLAQAEETAKKNKLEAKVLSEGPAKLAGRDAYQFLLLQQSPGVSATTTTSPTTSTSPAATTELAAADEPIILAQRTVCMSGTEEEGDKGFSLVLLYYGDDAADAAYMLDKLCSGFELFKPAAPSVVEEEPKK